MPSWISALGSLESLSDLKLTHYLSCCLFDARCYALYTISSTRKGASAPALTGGAGQHPGGQYGMVQATKRADQVKMQRVERLTWDHPRAALLGLDSARRIP
jgi:hypothetical protein